MRGLSLLISIFSLSSVVISHGPNGKDVQYDFNCLDNFGLMSCKISNIRGSVRADIDLQVANDCKKNFVDIISFAKLIPSADLDAIVCVTKNCESYNDKAVNFAYFYGFVICPFGVSQDDFKIDIELLTESVFVIEPKMSTGLTGSCIDFINAYTIKDLESFKLPPTSILGYQITDTVLSHKEGCSYSGVERIPDNNIYYDYTLGSKDVQNNIHCVGCLGPENRLRKLYPSTTELFTLMTNDQWHVFSYNQMMEALGENDSEVQDSDDDENHIGDNTGTSTDGPAGSDGSDDGTGTSTDTSDNEFTEDVDEDTGDTSEDTENTDLD